MMTLILWRIISPSADFFHFSNEGWLVNGEPHNPHLSVRDRTYSHKWPTIIILKCTNVAFGYLNLNLELDLNLNFRLTDLKFLDSKSINFKIHCLDPFYK